MLVMVVVAVVGMMLTMVVKMVMVHGMNNNGGAGAQ